MPPAFAPFDDKLVSRAKPSDPPDADAPAEGAFDALIAWYQRHARAAELPGMGCPFAPSCSRYARGAIHRHGPLALFLIVDRLLVREHAAAGAYYAPVCVAHATRLDDDVP